MQKLQSNLWKECLFCKNKCCKGQEGTFPICVTSEEFAKIEPKIKEKGYDISDFKDMIPCMFFDKNERCEIYDIRPFDCAIFPFDIIKIDGKFFWIYWELPFSCKILGEKDFEHYLQYFEEELIPQYAKYLEEFSRLYLDFFMGKFKYNIIRKVRLKQ